MAWHVSVLTLFPEMFPGFLGVSLAGKALRNGLWSYNTYDLRHYGLGRHQAVDDTPFGGGAGMVMRVDVLDNALSHVGYPKDRPLIYLTPRGEPLTQKKVRQYAAAPGLTILCGRYEGVDERIFSCHDMELVSVGDFVLSGGEGAALVMMDACIRLLSGVMGGEESADEESFSEGLLEYPQYTRPAEWKGMSVPDILVSGNHRAIRAWRRQEAEKITQLKRPDLWQAYISRSVK
ncbi:tRNA (guanosine(37)-N1)-methyltransferase TrmD [Entomobacter blattae]|uniref:tRNA (guanine-N(1)-)-methyltransferase n=1 Tax=Entomobacter blattae TaxID=2762277 RepID=A0A7H1NSS8_9PROT|nr:tRNA (guanosine(37)-N1)-methyltransferase TrmD [Entomobacter blattae]QNT78838.1 tRNA (guanine-N(1)-)-methyltransferase [Entomobacter blattae]